MLNETKTGEMSDKEDGEAERHAPGPAFSLLRGQTPFFLCRGRNSLDREGSRSGGAPPPGPPLVRQGLASVQEFDLDQAGMRHDGLPAFPDQVLFLFCQG